MDDQIINRLARNLSQVKNLSAEVNINNYYQEIRPFLFGVSSSNNLVINENNIPNGGLYSVVKDGNPVPSESPRIIVKIAGKTISNFKVADVTSTKFIEDVKPDENGKTIKNPGEYFFPSDVVRTLTGLARIFYDNGFNLEELKSYTSGSPDNLDLVKKWGKVNGNPELVRIDSGYFYEENFILYHQNDIKKLLDAVVKSAILLEKAGKPVNIQGFDLKSEVEKLIIKDVSNEIYKDFLNKIPEYLKKQENFEEVIKPILKNNDDFITKNLIENQEASNDLKKDILNLINENKLNFLEPIINKKDSLDYFEQIGAYLPKLNFFLFNSRENPQQIGLKDTEKYKDFIEKSTSSFLEKYSKNLFKKFVLSLFNQEKKTSSLKNEDQEEIGGLNEIETVKFTYPLNLEEFVKKITEDSTKQLVINFTRDFIPKYYNNFSEIKSKLPTDYLKEVIKSIFDNVLNKVTKELVFNEKELEDLASQGLYSNSKFNPEIVNNQWYQNLLIDIVQYITNLNEYQGQYSSYFTYLFEEYITPQIKDLNKLDSPISIEEFKKKLSEKIISNVYENFLNNYVLKAFKEDKDSDLDKSKDFSYYKNKIQENYSIGIKEAISNRVNINVINNFNISNLEKESLEKNKLFLNNTFDQKIFESSWYKNLVNKNIDLVIGDNSTKNESTSFFYYLYSTFIAPPILLLQNTSREQQEADESVEITRNSSGSVVPRDIPNIPSAELKINTDQISRLTPEELRTLQYESAWMYNRAIYELFTSKGIPQEELNQELLTNLQKNVFNYVSSMNESDFNKLFGSSSYRQKALLDFYQKTGYGINKFHTAKEILGNNLYKNFNLGGSIFTENVKNTLDGLIVQYGLNQDFFAFDPSTQEVTKYSGTNKHDVIWFIDNISPDRLALIFNLPSKFYIEDNETRERLKEAFKNYARCRASELSLSIQNTSLQNGLMVISDEDAEKIKNGDEETLNKHLNFTKDLRNLSKQYDGEVVAGSLDFKKENNRVDIQKQQYKTFLPLWGQLTLDEQIIIYEKFNKGHLVPKDFNNDPNARLPFISEFIYFDIREFDEISNIIKRINAEKGRELNKIEQQEIIEISLIQNQLIKEQRLANFLKIEIENEFTQQENQEILQTYNTPDQQSISTREIIVASQKIDQKTQKNQSRISKIFNRKKRNSFEKVNKVIKKASNEAISQAFSKGVAAASNLILPGIGVPLGMFLSGIKNKKLRNAISSGIVLGLGLLIKNTIHALGSIGGFIGAGIGGVIGGVSTFFGGGLMAVPAAISGALIGESILPQRWWGFWEGSNKSPSFTGAPILNSNSNETIIEPKPYSPPPPKNASFSKVLTSYEGLSLITIAGFSITTVFTTLFIVLIIQSAFLIPVPENLSPGRTVGAFGPNGFECFVFAGPGEEVETEYGTKYISKPWTLEEKQKVYQSYAREAGQNSCFNTYVCGSGEILIYRLSGFEYGGWAPSQLNGKAIYLYDLPFMSGSGVPFSSFDDLEYTFIHELGHIIDYKKTNDFLNKFEQIWSKADNGCLTYPYPGACNAGEAFAEAITLYTVYDTYTRLHMVEGIERGRGVFYDFPAEAPAEYEWVKENIYCNEATVPQEESYLAIGALTPENIVVSSSQEIETPRITCNWAEEKNLDVAINANFFNTLKSNQEGQNDIYTPVGIAGYCPPEEECILPVKYYQDATVTSINQNQKAFGFTKTGEFVSPERITDMKNQAPNLKMAVSGSYSEIQISQDVANKRTIIGTGIANSTCTKDPDLIGKPAMFMAVFPFSTYANAEEQLKKCGATNLLHLDGGNSSNFCSKESSFSQNRFIPVNMGMKKADIIIGKTLNTSNTGAL